jgi:hypothetical protein
MPFWCGHVIMFDITSPISNEQLEELQLLTGGKNDERFFTGFESLF